MSEDEEAEASKHNQVAQWLKKLERESWQLELLVSAFTIVLLLQANDAYQEFFRGLRYEYSITGDIITFIFFFFALIGVSIKALTMFLVLHLLLRGFWIGAIGLRSVQPTIDFSALNYSDAFTDRLRKKVRSLDDLVILLDQVCSVIFSFSFLVISMLIAFGLYLIFLGLTVFTGRWIDNLLGETAAMIYGFIVIPITLISGLIYLIDYFSLGFFKKFKWFSRFYLPFYRFYGFITFSGISRSIYYYLITKFSKNRIRWLYLIAMTIWIFSFTTEFDQNQYFGDDSEAHYLEQNYYDSERPEDDYIAVLSIPAMVIDGNYMPLFIRYDPEDNEALQEVCVDFEPPKNNGWNSKINFSANKSEVTQDADSLETPVEEKMLECLLELYRLSINEQRYEDLVAYFHEHPAKDQPGMLSMLSTADFQPGKNVLKLEKQEKPPREDTLQWTDVAQVIFWYDPNP